METNIKVRRMQLGMSMGELAVKAGLTRRKVEHIELGRAKGFRLEYLTKIAKALGCKVIDLLSESDIAKLGTALVLFCMSSVL